MNPLRVALACPADVNHFPRNEFYACSIRAHQLQGFANSQKGGIQGLDGLRIKYGFLQVEVSGIRTLHCLVDKTRRR